MNEEKILNPDIPSSEVPETASEEIGQVDKNLLKKARKNICESFGIKPEDCIFSLDPQFFQFEKMAFIVLINLKTGHAFYADGYAGHTELQYAIRDRHWKELGLSSPNDPERKGVDIRSGFIEPNFTLGYRYGSRGDF